jgi:GNAT superfamily N-acetyltransferase
MSAERNLAFVTAVPAQLAAVDRLMEASSRSTPMAGSPTRSARDDIFLAVDGDEIVGAMATKPRGPNLELALIGVSPARWKSGVASLMIGRIAELAPPRGARTLSLNTAEIMGDRVRLYARHGFAIVRRSPPEHGKDAYLRVYMERVLWCQARKITFASRRPALLPPARRAPIRPARRARPAAVPARARTTGR